MTDTFSSLIEKIDAANARDPNRELDDSGTSVPKEQLYARRMSAKLEQFCPDASEHLRIAAHGQHIERWTSARSDYPEGRSGYKQWRAELGLFHANRCAELMQECDYASDDIERVKYLVQKRGIKRDRETQTLEDVICLVFLDHYLEDFAAKHTRDKLIDILQKTWPKMSPEGQAAALQQSYSADMLNLIKEALGI